MLGWNWKKIRAGLRANATEVVRDAAVAVGKVDAGELPEDVAASVLRLFDHADPEVRQEAIRAIGLHWHLRTAFEAIADVLNRDEDEDVQSSAIGALGALGTEHAELRCRAAKALAQVVLNDRFKDCERISAYIKLLLVEGRIDFEDYIERSLEAPDRLAAFEVDRPWVEELARRDCSQPSDVAPIGEPQ